jgi:tryptophanyl-tRNA synthetase
MYTTCYTLVLRTILYYTYVQYLGFFLEDDAELKQIGDDYASGKLLTGDVKAKLTAVLTTLVQQHQERRAAVTDDVLQQFLAVRPLDF